MRIEIGGEGRKFNVGVAESGDTDGDLAVYGVAARTEREAHDLALAEARDEFGDGRYEATTIS